MFRKLDDFLQAYEALTEGTLKICEALGDEALHQTANDGHRSLGHMAWHIVVTIPEMMNRTGLGLSSVDSEAPPPGTAAEIVSAYRTVSEELKAAVSQFWDDAALEKTDEMYGEVWPRGRTLMVLVNHEIHHRGQMTVLMRMAGVRVPGIYGPSKEEWANYGMDPPLY